MTPDSRPDPDTRRYRAIFDSAVDYAIVVTDRDGIVTDWNPGAQRMLGWAQHEILGQTAECFFTPEDRAAGRAGAEMREALARGRADDERWHLRKDGSRLWSGGELMPLRAPDGTHIGFLKILRDRTERRAMRDRIDADRCAAENALKQNESHWRGIFENLAEGFVLGEVIRDEAGRAVDWRYLELNRAWGDLVGVAPAAALGRTLREVLPGIEEDWITGFAAVAETGRAMSFTRYVAPLDQWFEGRCHPMGPDRFAAMFTNVSERRRAERFRAALLELGDRLRATQDHREMARQSAALIGETLGASRAGYATVEDGECVVVEADWTAAGVDSIAGRHGLRDYGRYGDDLRRGELVAIADVALDSRTASNEAAFAALGIRSLLNLPILENGRFVALFLLNGAQPRQWQPSEIAFVREVADQARQAVERCRAEEALRALNASLERAIEDRTRERDRLWATSEDLLLVMDAQGRMLRTSPSWHALLGLDDAALRGTPCQALIHPDDLELTEANLRGMAAGRPVRQECRMRAADGGWKWVAWRFSPDPASGRTHGIGRDVTAEREQAEAQARLEEQLRQSQKMEAVGQLTGGLAHDFNNLLTGITGSLELLQTRLAQGRLKDLDRYIDASQGAAKRAAALTHRLLAFSRQQTLDPRPADMDRLVAGMEELIRRTVGPAVTVEVAARDGLWTTMVDPNQLENALLNLCINARDAMPRGGRLTIETCNLSLDERAAPMRGIPAGQYVSLCVSDSGAGMTPEVAARAFDPFFTTKPLGQGTGLGLSMIYGFVRQSGGQVRLYSEPGEGTMACLYLPRHFGPEEADARPDARPDMPRAERGQQVLVVDDEPVVRMLVVEVLEELGYGAIEASDGAGGLRLLQSDARIDLLVTDVGLPGGMNGRQMADLGRLTRPDLTVLFITGFAENAVVSHGHLDKDMHVITKPFALETLATRIRDLIGGAARPPA